MELYVHAGIFHADDVFCAAFLRLYGAEPVVHRVNEVTDAMLEEARQGRAIICDIGLKYDPERNLFDHHQPDAPVRENGIRYAAFGLLIRTWWKPEWTWRDLFDREFVQPIDACDNGQSLHTVNRLIRAFVPAWNSTQSMDEAFDEAAEFAYGILRREFRRREANAAAEKIVRAAAARATDGVIVLERFVPFAGCIDGTSGCKGVVYPGLRGGSVCQILPAEAGGKTLCGSFSGIRAGENGCGFIHSGGFLASFDTREQAISAAKAIIPNPKGDDPA